MPAQRSATSPAGRGEGARVLPFAPARCGRSSNQLCSHVHLSVRLSARPHTLHSPLSAFAFRSASAGSGAAMTQQGATLQNYNNELVKCAPVAGAARPSMRV